MKNISLFCLTLNPSHEKLIKKLSFIPVGLGDKKFSENCVTDKKGLTINNKNPYYGEYTFHYWIWKNYLDQIKTPWVGFCQYRKFFIKKKNINNKISFEELKNLTSLDFDNKIGEFDCILGTKFSVQNYKFSKIVKNYLLDFLLNPNLFFNKKKRNLKLHFDLYHGKGNLNSAIEHLDYKNKHQFSNYMINENSFHPHNMFICKTKILKNYYNEIFPWLEKCEKQFGFDNLEGYGLQRIYGFLAERFLSYWFSKNYKVKELPIFVKDLSDYDN
jgi:hypothetical protein